MKQMEFTKPHSHPLRKWRGTPKSSIIFFFFKCSEEAGSRGKTSKRKEGAKTR